jgi:Undecaprenyl-phosphate galactose phosphotransferase WbaP
MTSRSDAATDLTRTLVTVNARQAKWMTHLALTATDIVAFASVLGLLELTSMVFAPAFSTPIWSAGLLIPLLLASFVTLGLYQHTRMHPADEMRLASQVTLALGITAAVAVYISGSNGGMAPVLGAAGGLGAVVVPLCRGFFRVICARANWWGQSAIIIGSEEEASAVVDTLRRWPEIGLRPVAVLTDSHVDAHQGIWTGSRSMALHLAANHDIPCAIVAEPSMDAEARDKLIARYSKFFENVLVVPDVKKGAAALWRTGRSHQGLVAYGVSHYELQVGASIAKRVADLIGAAILTILAAPVLAVIALLIKIDSPGPVFYSQNRMGRQGRCFSVQKFRTMKVNADAVLQEMLDSDPALRREYEQFHKLENDPRVTRIGRVLRRYSLDELPQLFNVIVGDMSLVGPRAYMPRELPQMKNLAQIVLQTPPGITGLWQVSGRNALSFERRVDLDVHYFKNWSPWLDLYLLIRTVPVVLSGDGAS